MSEARLADNARLPRELREALNGLLEGSGIRTDTSVEKMVGPYRNDHNPFMIDDFLDLDEAA